MFGRNEAGSLRWSLLASLALALAAGLGAACTDGAEQPHGAPSKDATTPGSSNTESSVPRTVVRASLVGVDTADLPPLRPAVTGMPGAIPGIDAALPSLLDDLPGRAVMVVNPEITVVNVGVHSWSELNLLFFGVDGRWRRLSLGDLGLPESLIYLDTYGAGELSGDGRWWAGPTSRGMVALNLATGQTRLIQYGPGAWIPRRHSILTNGLEYTVPGGVVTHRVPYTGWQVGYEPDGTPLSLERSPEGQAILVEWSGRTRHPRAVVPGVTPPRRQIRQDSTRPLIRADQLSLVYPTDGQFAYPDIRGRDRLAVVVYDSETGEEKAELMLRRGELFHFDVWLDEQTLLVAAAPYIMVWRPETGELFRVTDARSLSDNYWDVSIAQELLAR